MEVILLLPQNMLAPVAMLRNGHRNEIKVGRMYGLGHLDDHFWDIYIHPVAVKGLSLFCRGRLCT